MDPCSVRTPNKPTVLIIDDEPSNIHVLSEILKDAYRVVFSMSGVDGIQVAAKNQPDIILLDVNMPHMDGFHTCLRLKQHPALKDIPVIFVTMMGALDDEVKGFEVGAVDYITRPLHAVTVIKRIQTHLRIKDHWHALQDMILLDGLTGLANRRGFGVAFDREWRRAVRKHYPFSLIMADIDHFKAYNDHYGHTAGDNCLRIVAGVFRRQMQRPNDLAARYGGEEIVCLLPDTDAAGAYQVTKRLQASLAASSIPHAASPIAKIVTISFGIATATADACIEPNDLLHFADQLLYQAKGSGKNRWVAGVLQQPTGSSAEKESIAETTNLSHPLTTDEKKALWHSGNTMESPTILIIDNDPNQIEVLTNMLEQHYHILSALSGEDGLKIADAVTPDLILLDMMTPHTSGFQVCQQFKGDAFLKEIPIIFVTGMTSVYDEAQGFEVGAVDYITRPFQPPVVRNRVKNHLELKMQRDILRRLATTDSLTGIVNRRGFDESLAREWFRSIRNQSPISLIMADIDCFKAYNDHCGHLAGDECLHTIASVLHRQMQRPGDLAARYGGEEMVCLLPDTGEAGALQVTQRLQASLALCAIPHPASPVAKTVTLSFGIATATNFHAASGSFEALLQLADQCLYEAKNAGRNQVKTALLTQ